MQHFTVSDTYSLCYLSFDMYYFFITTFEEHQADDDATWDNVESCRGILKSSSPIWLATSSIKTTVWSEKNGMSVLYHSIRHPDCRFYCCIQMLFLGVPWPPTCSYQTQSINNLVQAFDMGATSCLDLWPMIIDLGFVDMWPWQGNLHHPTSNFKWATLTKCTC